VTDIYKRYHRWLDDEKLRKNNEKRLHIVLKNLNATRLMIVLESRKFIIVYLTYILNSNDNRHGKFVRNIQSFIKFFSFTVIQFVIFTTKNPDNLT